MKQKQYYETPLLEIIVLPAVSVLTVSQGEGMTPSGDYDQNGDWL